MQFLEEYINNKLNIKSVKFYCGIIGESPSKGARSPLLWNECFNNLNISSYFYPFDVENEGLEALVNFLKNDDTFLGGAVAIPHKESIIPFLDFIEDEAKRIGAVNLIYKKNGAIWGSNTDGLGAVCSVSDYMGLELKTFAKSKKAVLLGTGGVAKSCAIYFSKYIGEFGEIVIVGRDMKKAQELSAKSNNYCKSRFIKFDTLEEEIIDTDFLINCTSIGYENNIKVNDHYFYYEPFNPLSSLPDKGFTDEKKNIKDKWTDSVLDIIINNFSESSKLVKKIKKSAVVFDVIYQPNETMLLKISKLMGYKTLSGKQMNLLQAAYGFLKVFSNKDYKINKITKIMKGV